MPISSSSSSSSSSTHARPLQAAPGRPRSPPSRTPFLALDSDFHKLIASFLATGIHVAVKVNSLCQPPSPNPFTYYGMDETLVLSRRLLEELLITEGERFRLEVSRCIPTLTSFLLRMRQQIKVIVVDMGKSSVAGCTLPLDLVFGAALCGLPRDVRLSFQEIIIRGGP